jgi:hypothetical protein
VCVIVNGSAILKGSTAERPVFSSASFVNSDKGFLFLGSAIRFFKSTDVDLRPTSPSSVEGAATDILTMTAFNLTEIAKRSDVEVPSICQAVPDFGFRVIS